MKVAAIIVGIDGWEKYTLPLVESIKQHEPECDIVVIDNDSATPYPTGLYGVHHIARSERLCYSAAINMGQEFTGRTRERWISHPDWYIVLSNDVLCTGPFRHILEQYDSDVVGPLMKSVHGFPYIEGWCVCIPRRIWEAVGGWDERFQGSDWEDVDFSTTARERGFGLVEDVELPFVHLDQRQRYTIVEDFWGKNSHNQGLFMQKHVAVTA